MEKVNLRETIRQIFNRNGVISFTATNAALTAMGHRKIAKTTYHRNKSEIIKNGGIKATKPPADKEKPTTPLPDIVKPVGIGAKTSFTKPSIVSGTETAAANPKFNELSPPMVSIQAALLLLKDLTKDVEAEKINKVRQAIQKVGGLANFDNLMKFLATLRA